MMTSPRILLIEDDPSVRHGMAAFLRANGLEVQEAETCRQALELYRSGDPAVVVADYSLPDGTSLDILAQVKRNERADPVHHPHRPWLHRPGRAGHQGGG